MAENHTAFSTCDFGDLFKSQPTQQAAFRVLPPVFKHYGGASSFYGPVRTVQCFEDNTPVKQALESPGHGAVLVVAGGGSLARALVGGNIAASAAANGWAGVVVDAAVRDVAELGQVPVGICALGLNPLPTERKVPGERDLAIRIQGVSVTPNDWIYVDADGIVISDQPLHLPR